MPSFDSVAERPLTASAQDAVYRLEDLRLMFGRNAKKDGLPQRACMLQPARMAQAGLPVGDIVRQGVEKEVFGHINFL